MATDEPAHPWLTDEIEDLCRAFASLRTVDEFERFLRDLCTLGELEAMAHRWEVAQLLDDGGLGPEQPGERALAFPCRNAPVEVLLVRAADIPEYVQDGVVDCGITGADLVAERGARVTELLRLGFGGCTLEAAVPEESPVDDLAGLAGLRVATV